MAEGLAPLAGKQDGAASPSPWSPFNGFWSLLLSVLSAVVVLSRAELSLGAFRRKVALYFYGAAYLLLSHDSKFNLPPDPGKSTAQVVKTKRIVFVRHGESVWNECFNRPLGISLPLRLMRACIVEAALFFCLDSLFFDSPLSEEGLAQARLLEQFVEGDSGEELRRLCESAVFTTSLLRRAAQTGLVAFGRALQGGRPVWILSALQEISRNVDTLALAGPLCAPPVGSCIGNGGVGGKIGSASVSPGFLQPAYNFGNKSLMSNGAHRLEAFCEWVFSESSPASMQPTVVVFGHSLWFRTFFQVYLPHIAAHECKVSKIVNCGVIAFDLELLRSSGEGIVSDGSHDGSDGCLEYRIVPDSVVTLYGGFEAKKERRKSSGTKRD